jgi:hypothetical protein
MPASATLPEPKAGPVLYTIKGRFAASRIASDGRFVLVTTTSFAHRRFVMHSRSWKIAFVAVTVTGAACAPAPVEYSQAEALKAPILGPLTVDQATCDNDHWTFLELTLHYARTLVETPAFGQCLETAVRDGFAGIGPYKECPGDPAEGASARRAGLLADRTVTTSNATLMHCGGSQGNAAANVEVVGDSGPEEITWAGWLDAVIEDLSEPLCDEGGGSPCRFAADPWPYSQAAGIAFHEAAHQQGWRHPRNPDVLSADAKAECGYAPEDDYNYQQHSMPYIIGNCASWLIAHSAEICGAPIMTVLDDRNYGLNLIDGIDSANCQGYTDVSQGWYRPIKTGERHQ